MPTPDFEIDNTKTTPPGGWSYKHPLSPKPFTDYDYSRWRKTIEDFFMGNDIPMGPNWLEMIHSQACEQNPHWGKFCKRWTGKVNIKRKPVSFAVLMQFLKVLGKWIASGGKLVDQEEANRRAAICTRCPYNAPENQGCGTCMASLLSGIHKLKGDRSTPSDSLCGSCLICGCELKTAVWFPLSAQTFGLTEEMKNQFKEIPYCWKNENL